MRITCPSCQFSKEVPSAKVPPQGVKARCQRCSTIFLVIPEAQQISCPKCDSDLDATGSCAKCGLIYEKYLAAKRRQEIAPGTPEAMLPPKITPPAVVSGTPHEFGHGRSELLAWVAAGHLAVDALPEAFRLAGTLPGPREWRRFLDGLVLWLGVVFLAAAVIFFFAFNWQKLGHYIRFGSVELVLVAAVVATWRLGLERLVGKAALLLATLLVGALLALVGQTYQTGADPWELFATWALFVLPWVAISRFSPLWLFLLLLLNLAVIFYFKTFASLAWDLFSTERIWWILAGVNTAAQIIWELTARRGIPWLVERWAVRVIATAAAGLVTVLAVWGIIDRHVAGLAEIGVYSGWLVCAYVVYRHLVLDLYLLSLGALSLITVVAVFLGHNLFHRGEEVGLLVLGLLVLGLSAASGRWLRSVAKEVA